MSSAPEGPPPNKFRNEGHCKICGEYVIDMFTCCIDPESVILHDAPEYEMILMPPAVVYVLIVYYHYEHTEILGVYEDKAQAVNAALHCIATKEVAKFQESNDNPCYWNGPNTDYEVKSFNVL